MKKVNCYSKYAYCVYLLMFALTIIIGILPFILFKEDDSSIFKIIWICIIVFCIGISLYGFFHHQQYLYVKDDKFILKTPFLKINELIITECYYEISMLPSNYGRRYVYEKWICIYLREDGVKKFKSGFSNSRRHKGIQLIYNEKNLEFISNYIKNINNWYN